MLLFSYLRWEGEEFESDAFIVIYSGSKDEQKDAARLLDTEVGKEWRR